MEVFTSRGNTHAIILLFRESQNTLLFTLLSRFIMQRFYIIVIAYSCLMEPFICTDKDFYLYSLSSIMHAIIISRCNNAAIFRWNRTPRSETIDMNRALFIAAAKKFKYTCLFQTTDNFCPLCIR